MRRVGAGLAPVRGAGASAGLAPGLASAQDLRKARAGLVRAGLTQGFPGQGLRGQGLRRAQVVGPLAQPPPPPRWCAPRHGVEIARTLGFVFTRSRFYYTLHITHYTLHRERKKDTKTQACVCVYLPLLFLSRFLRDHSGSLAKPFAFADGAHSRFERQLRFGKGLHLCACDITDERHRDLFAVFETHRNATICPSLKLCQLCQLVVLAATAFAVTVLR